jgi:hypothetical protein
MYKVCTNKNDIIEAFKELGFQTNELDFDKECEDKYKDFNWCLIPHHRVKIVLYSVPVKDKLETLPWQSWYLDNGKETHHIHYSEKKHDSDFSWIQNEPTDERPQEVIGRLWYWYDDPDMKPVLLK